ARGAGSPDGHVVFKPAMADVKSCEDREALVENATAEGIARVAARAACAADSPILAQGGMCDRESRVKVDATRVDDGPSLTSTAIPARASGSANRFVV